MKGKNDLTPLFVTILISAASLLIIFLVILFSNKRAFTHSGDFIEAVVLILGLLMVGSAIGMAISIARKKKSQYDAIINNQLPTDICPNCRINVSPDCKVCPNCKSVIQRS